MANHKSPLEVAVALFGSQPAVETVCALVPGAVYIWRRGSIHRDPGDIPSARHMRALLAHARREGLPLTADHLIHGATEAELAALLAARPAAVAEAPAPSPAQVAAE